MASDQTRGALAGASLAVSVGALAVAGWAAFATWEQVGVSRAAINERIVGDMHVEFQQPDGSWVVAGTGSSLPIAPVRGVVELSNTGKGSGIVTSVLFGGGGFFLKSEDLGCAVPEQVSEPCDKLIGIEPGETIVVSREIVFSTGGTEPGSGELCSPPDHAREYNVSVSDSSGTTTEFGSGVYAPTCEG